MRTALKWTGMTLAGVGLALAVGELCAAPKDATAATAEAPACHTLVVPVNQPAPEGCARVTADQLGQLPLELEVGGRTVRFAEWTATDETQAELVGFAAHLPADVIYTVRAGSDVFVGGQPRWLHPAGFTGPRVRGIDQVTFCRLPPRSSACPGSGVVIDESTPVLAAR